jgi:hypothetical protein
MLRSRPRAPANPVLELFLEVAFGPVDVRTCMKACSWCLIILDGTPTPRFERYIDA